MGGGIERHQRSPQAIVANNRKWRLTWELEKECRELRLEEDGQYRNKLEKVIVQTMKEKFRKVKRQIGDKKKKDKRKIQYKIENMIGGGYSIHTEIEWK